MPTYYFSYFFQSTELQQGYRNSYITLDKLNKKSIEKAQKNIASDSSTPLRFVNILSITKLDD